MLRNVYLDGELGEKYGKELQISANSLSDVFRCLEVNFSDFRTYLLDCHEKNIGFICEVQGRPLKSEKELLLQFQEGDMYISPQPAGSKSGAGKILAAIAVVALTIGTGGFTAGFSFQTLGSGLGSIAGGGSAGVLVGTNKALAATLFASSLAQVGIQQMMMPDPSVDSQQDESYLFQGSGQTLVEGDPVPVLYGELRVPGRPISMVVRNQNGYFYNGATLSATTTGYGSSNTTINDTSETPDPAGTSNPGNSNGGQGSGSGHHENNQFVDHK